MEGSCPESCITDPRNKRVEGTSWEQRRKEAPLEGASTIHGWMHTSGHVMFQQFLAETMAKSQQVSARLLSFWTKIRTLGVLYTVQQRQNLGFSRTCG